MFLLEMSLHYYLQVRFLVSSTSDIKTREAKESLEETKEKLQVAVQKGRESWNSVQEQIQSFGSQIRDYLNQVQADIETYKFSVEKRESGLAIDVMFRATLKPKASEKKIIAQ
jgi:hypothetical protein